MECPCDRCIVKAICRHRKIEDLISHCPLVKDYTQFRFNLFSELSLQTNVYYDRDNYHRASLDNVYKTLQPTYWSVQL